MNGDGYSRDGRSGGGGSRNYSSRDDHRERGERSDRGDRRRRRSRSPRHSSRRDYEVDTYSSSRDYREREREDTYARRDRRDDRAWGDSYSRRDRPRHERDDERGERGDRAERPERAERGERVERGERGERGAERGDRGHRRGGDRDREWDREERGGRGRRDGGFGGGGRDRKKSASPAPKQYREPTPEDLSSFASVLNRPRRMTQWDIKPSGYENITAEQAKLSGMFPLPGAPRAAPMDPSRIAAFLNPGQGTASASALQPEHSKQAKRVYVYNLPPDVTSEEIIDFFNIQLNGLNLVSANDPCLSASIATNKEYALVEFKAPDDATVVLAMDGVSMRDNAGGPDQAGLSIRRPRDYITPSANEDQPEGDQVSSEVKDSPHKLSIVNIPTFVEEEQLLELLQTFGKLKSFTFVKDSNDQHRGIAFCEYADASITADAMDGLNSIALGDGNLKVNRATHGVQQTVGVDGGVGAISMLAGSTAADDHQKSRVLCLLNMVTHDELINDEDYEEIKEDVEEECGKYGPIIEVKIPRPAGARANPGVGKIFIKYEDSDSAQKALKALAGRQFSNRTVVVTEFSEEGFDVEAW